MKKVQSCLAGMILLFVLTCALPAPAALLVNTNAAWKYWKGTTEASTVPDMRAWRSNSFSDATWLNGSTPFWYGDVQPGGTQLPDMQNTYSCIFIRRTFTLTNVAEISALRLSAACDDGFIAYINGAEVYRFNMPAGDPVITTFFAINALGDVQPFSDYDLNSPAPSSYLLVGNNTLAIQVFNATLGSSDLGFDVSLTSFIAETNPPTITDVTPDPGILTSLTQITVEFSELVVGVNATDLLVNGQFASSVVGSGASYAFTFIQPAYGPVQISWDIGHGITDFALPGNSFDRNGAGATWQYTLVDETPPAVVSVDPTAGFTVTALGQIGVLFSEGVSGVDAEDLLINGVPATNVSVVAGSGDKQYIFQFAQPANGTVQVAWTNTHGIQDLAAAPNAFPGGGWSYVLDPNATSTLLVISEFVAENDNGMLDEDNETSDWIEIYNAGSATVNLRNWFLTDNPDNLDKWQFPSTNLPPNAYLIVWASEKDKRVSGQPLHTNFKLEGGGEFLALLRSNDAGGLEIIWQYAPEYPNQEPNLSYGLAMNVGVFGTLIAPGAGAKVLVPSGDLGVTWTARDFVDTSWSNATTGIGFDTGTNYDPGIATDIQAQMLNVNPSAFIRVPFTVADPSVIQDLRLRLRYDDGFVAYLNGVEAARANAPANPQWNSMATALHGSGSGGGTPTLQDFDNTGSTYVLQQFAGAFPPAATTNAGSTNRFMRLANQTGSINNSMTFNRTAAGVFSTVVATFDFRVTPVSSQADGFGFALMNTALYGTNGNPGGGFGGVSEEANLAGSIGVGFDVYNNGTAVQEPNDNHLSLHYGSIVSPAAAIPTFDISNGQWHRAQVTVDFNAGNAYVTVRLTPNIGGVPGATETLFNNFLIPGVAPYESRASFGARTGGAWADHDFDNVNIQYGFASGMVAAEEFNISSSLNTLVSGVNVLAIHGLNRATNDADFLITPELVGRSVALLTNTPNYYSVPTPGAANEGGAVGVAGEPVYSIPGGVYTNASLSVTLSTMTPGGVIRYTIDGTTPTAASPAYGTALNIVNSTVVKARVFAPGMLPGRIVTQTYTMLGADVTVFTSNLPLVIIDTFGVAIGAENKVPASMVFIDTFRGRSSLRGTPDAQVRAGIELRGSSSLGFAKNSMGFETRDENTNDFAVSLLGMPAESDWVLYAPYTDKTFMNDHLAYELWDEMGHYSVRRKFVEVFRDTSGGRLTYADYWGIYVLLEKIKIDNDRVDIPQLNGGDNTEPNVTGGYILKRDRLDGNEYVFNVNAGTGFAGTTLGVEDPKGAQISQAQKNWLVAWFNQMAAALGGPSFTNAVTGYAAYLDADSFIDHYWIVEMPKQIDGYRLSNFYHKDRNGKLKEGPIWDWNLSFGNANYATGGQTNGYYWTQTGGADYPWYPRLFADPDFNQKHIDRWASLRTNVFSNAGLLARVEAVTNLLNEAQARDFAKWPRLFPAVSPGQTVPGYVWPNPSGGADHINYTSPSNYAGIISEMKRWLTGRLAWIDAQFTRPPEFNLAAGPVPSGTMLTITAPAGTVYYTLDGTDPRVAGGHLAPGVRTNTGPITITNNVRVFARARVGTGANSWSGPTVASYVVQTPQVVLTEIMYHPTNAPTGGLYNDDDYEYLEVKNVGSTPVNLRNYRFSGAVDCTLSNLVLNPGAVAVVVRSVAAFQSRHGTGAVIAGTFGADNLDNAGERIVLHGGLGEPIHDFAYDDEWYPSTDGFGFSLVIVNENAALNTWGLKASWRPSGALNGSPGANDPAPPARPGILITEALTHTVLPAVDSIEVFNPTGGSVDIGGWYLTDDYRQPHKYRIPDNTVLDSGEYRVFTSAQFNAPPGGSNSFGLSAQGDEVYIFSADGAGNLTGYLHGHQYGGADNGVSFGRHITLSDQKEHFVAQVATSPGGPNAGPKVGPVVIGEIMYRPPDVFLNSAYWDNGEDEYIELRNITGDPVSLFESTAPSNTWKLRDAVSFDFATNVTITGNGYVLVVSFDPTNSAQLAAFRGKYGLTPAVPIYGPYAPRQLDNSGESIELVKPAFAADPDAPGTNVLVQVLVDKVRYFDMTPWPVGADGIGPALQRVNVNAFGNDPDNWRAALPTPGAGYAGGEPPVITTHPLSQTNVSSTTATLSVTAGGPGPLRYQWRKDGANLVGATNETLVIPDVQVANAGTYAVVVINPNDSVSSSNAVLTVLNAARISTQPQSQTITNGGNITFTVVATSDSPPITYQWRHDGTNLPGANGPTLSLPNVQLGIHNGTYQVMLTDGVASVPSAIVQLTILVRPAIQQQPTPASQTVAVGGTATLTLSVSNNATLPMGFRWRRGGTAFVGPCLVNGTPFIVTSNNPILINSHTLVFTLTNMQTTNAGTWTCVPTNLAGALLPFTGQVQAGLTLAGVITVVTPVAITLQPTNQTTNVGAIVNFNAAASGTAPIGYQWWFNGANRVTGATNASLSLTNVQLSNDGAYTLVATNAGSAATSQVAYLSLLVPPAIVTQPTNRTTTPCSNVAFYVEATGGGPLRYQWWFNETNALIGATNNCLLIAPPSPASAGGYSVVVSNVLNAVTSQVAVLTVTLGDSDGDGMPDEWELANGFDPCDGSDRNEDADNDGQKNWQEQVAGTDPRDAGSYLKIDQITAGGSATIWFMARSNKTYTVEYNDHLPAVADWHKVGDVEAAATNRPAASVVDPTPSTSRAYRLVTPKQ